MKKSNKKSNIYGKKHCRLNVHTSLRKQKKWLLKKVKGIEMRGERNRGMRKVLPRK